MPGHVSQQGSERGKHRGQWQIVVGWNEEGREESRDCEIDEREEENVIMDMTGGLAPAVQALSAQLPGLMDKLTAAGATDEATALQAAHDDITQALATVQSEVISPLLSRIDQLLSQVGRALTLLESFGGGVQILPIPPKS